MILLENVVKANWKNEDIRQMYKKYLLKKDKKTAALKTEEWEVLLDTAQLDGKIDFGLDHFMLEIGYIAQYMKLDTKQFYLPQTRQRGYMLCIDGKFFNGGKPLLDKKEKTEAVKASKLSFKNWTTILGHL